MARKSPGVAKLLAIMKKLSVEVNDQEICRRLEILMHSEKEDLPAAMIKELTLSPEKFDPVVIQDPYAQYIRHYLYMVKRAGKERLQLAEASIRNADRKRNTRKQPKARKNAAKPK